MNNVIFSILLVLIGLFVGVIVMTFIAYLKGTSASAKAEKIIENAKKEAEKAKRDGIVELKEETYKLKSEADKEIKEKKLELKDNEDRLLQREANIDRRDQSLQNREAMLEEKENALTLKQKEIQETQVKVEEMMNLEVTSYIKEREAEAKLEADKNAKDMLVECMQRYAGDVANEQTVTVVQLPNDEMKGRIIGREGRNIRTIEAVTGVDLIIDDTPEAIVLSSFDPYRRELARLTIEALIKDGRIHPTRIEELYDKTSKELSVKIREYGEDALFKLGLSKVDPGLVELIGKLHFRTSYGQNVLQHSIEVATLSGLIASELGENETIAKRAGLLHDIGKSIDHEVEGSHVQIGSDIAHKYHESDIVINAIESHHGDTSATSVIAVIVAIADALSASRPGARNDSLENYVKRLQDLEGIAKEIDGVDTAYALQAGREIRVVVKPDKVDDLGSFKIARDIKNDIEEKLQYPGTIKVTVIRETRAEEVAK